MTLSTKKVSTNKERKRQEGGLVLKFIKGFITSLIFGKL